MMRFGGGRGGRSYSGVEVDDDDTAIGGEVDAVVWDAGLLCLMPCYELNF